MLPGQIDVRKLSKSKFKKHRLKNIYFKEYYYIAGVNYKTNRQDVKLSKQRKLLYTEYLPVPGKRYRLMNKISNRIKSIDQLRGFAVVAMILVNYLAFYKHTPVLLKHAPGTGLTLADIVAPLFMFIIGLLYRKSLFRRISIQGKTGAWGHFLQRYFIIFLIGLLGSCIGKGSIAFHWGVFQTIGLSGLIILPFIGRKYYHRIAVAVLFLLFYQTFILPSYKYDILNADHGGPLAVVSWSTILLLSSFCGDFLNEGINLNSINKILVLGVTWLASGTALAILIPVSKHEVNMAFILITTGISSLLFLLFLLVNDIFKINLPTLGILGRNAFLLYLLHYALVRFCHALIPEDTAAIYILSGAMGIYLIIYLTAMYLNKKMLFIKV